MPPVVWTNISVLLMLSLVFWVMRAYGNRPSTTFWYGLGFLLGAAGWLSNVIRESLPDWALLLSNGLFFFSATALLIGVCRWRSVKVPARFVGSIAVISFLTSAWFLFVDYSTEFRIAVLSVSIALMFAAICYVLMINRGPSFRGFSAQSAVGVIAGLQAIVVIGQWPVHLYGPDISEFLDISVGTFVLLVFKPALQTGMGLFLVLGLFVDNYLKIQELTVFDPVTKLLDEKGFYRQSALDLARFNRDRRRISVMLIDLDHYDRMIETFGREIGDSVLVRTADVLRRSMRLSDVLGRLSDGHFVALAFDTDDKKALEIAERARIDMHSIEVEETDPIFRIRGSFGVSQVDELEINIDNAIERAQAALTAALNAGGDRSICHNTNNVVDGV